MTIKEILAQVSSHYNLEPTDYRVLSENESCITILVHSSQDYILKISKQPGDEKLLREATIQNFLMLNSFPVARVIPTKDKKIIYGYKGHSLFLMEYIKSEKNILQHGMNEELAYNIGGAMAQLANLLINANFSLPKLSVIDYLNSLKSGLKTISDLRGYALEKVFSDLEDFLLENNLSLLTCQPVHLDLHPKNILVEQNNVNAILDFAEVHIAPRMLDLSKVIALTCFDYNKPFFNYDFALQIISGSTIDTKLDDYERHLLYYFIKLSLLEIMIKGIIKLDVLENNSNTSVFSNQTLYLETSDVIANSTTNTRKVLEWAYSQLSNFNTIPQDIFFVKLFKLSPEQLADEGTKINLSGINDFKPKPGLNNIYFEFEEQELNKSSGEKISDFLNSLKAKNVDFKITKPLPRCLFDADYYLAIEEFGIPKSCKECQQLFSVNENGMVVFCDVLKGRIGPKFEYMKDSEQIYEYFKTFYSQMETLEKCESCKYAMRKQCNTCFNKK